MCARRTQTCAPICRKSKTRLIGKFDEIDKRQQLEVRVIRIGKHVGIPKPA
jgi:hypothetical protein